ncbi:MAG: PrsW family glutamic-type intramembrane protease [Chloroflexota bacterium]
MLAKTEPVWRYWLLVIVLAVGMIAAYLMALVSLVAGVIFLTPRVAMPPVSALFFFNLAWSSALIGALITRAFVSVLRPRPAASHTNGFIRASAALLPWSMVVLVFQSVEQSELAWLFLPPLVVIGAVVPVWWLLELARRRIDPLPDSRVWGIPALSLIITIPFTLLASIFGLVLFFIGVAVHLMNRPELMAQLQPLMENLSRAQADPALIEQMTNILFGDPVIIALVISLVAGFVPLLEELLKPLALWLFASDRLTPAQGFLGGVLCGAAFGFWENINALNNAGEGAGGGTVILVARVGSVLLHMTATGMLGWGMASFWQQPRYWLRLAGSYLLAVGLHAGWNLFAILSAVPALPHIPLRLLPVESGAENNLAWLALALLALFNLFLLLFMNAHLRRSAAAVVYDPPPPPAEAENHEP